MHDATRSSSSMLPRHRMLLIAHVAGQSKNVQRLPSLQSPNSSFLFLLFRLLFCPSAGLHRLLLAEFDARAYDEQLAGLRRTSWSSQPRDRSPATAVLAQEVQSGSLSGEFVFPQWQRSAWREASEQRPRFDRDERGHAAVGVSTDSTRRLAVRPLVRALLGAHWDRAASLRHFRVGIGRCMMQFGPARMLSHLAGFSQHSSKMHLAHYNVQHMLQLGYSMSMGYWRVLGDSTLGRELLAIYQEYRREADKVSLADLGGDDAEVKDDDDDDDDDSATTVS